MLRTFCSGLFLLSFAIIATAFPSNFDSDDYYDDDYDNSTVLLGGGIDQDYDNGHELDDINLRSANEHETTNVHYDYDHTTAMTDENYDSNPNVEDEEQSPPEVLPDEAEEEQTENEAETEQPPPEEEQSPPEGEQSPSDDEQPPPDGENQPPEDSGREQPFGENPGDGRSVPEQLDEQVLSYPLNQQAPVMPQVRIIGGEVAVSRANFSYQASFRFRSTNNHFCGATVIDSTHLLTAAHCVVSTSGLPVSPSNLKVVVGDLNTRSPTMRTVTRDVLEIFVHEEFNDHTFQNDIAVLRVQSLGDFDEYVRKAELADETPTGGTYCVVSGWGTTASGGVTSADLRYVEVPIVSTEECMMNYADAVMDGMLCAGYMEGRKDACQGDSGGPLVCDGKLAGVVSWGYYCALPGYPGIYADVAQYRSWILEQQGDAAITVPAVEIPPEGNIVRILGNDTVQRRDEFAYQVSLRFRIPNAHFCGGAIIDENHLVTSAHCVIDGGDVIDPDALTVIAGDLNIMEETENTVYRKVSAIFTHPDYTEETFENDIAVLRVDENFEFSNWINSIQIPVESPLDNTSCVVSGWGASPGGRVKNEDLRFARIPIVPVRSCSGVYTDSLKPGMLCAGHLDKGKDTCHGDSGGPLVCNGNLAGVASWGHKCAGDGFPGVYTDVSVFGGWIEEQKQRSSTSRSTASSALIVFIVLASFIVDNN